jgi:hypothetical protein
MTKESQRRAVSNQRKRMAERGQIRFEVRGLPGDKDLVRKFAQKLATGDSEAAKLRDQVRSTVAPTHSTGADLYRALRQGPLFPDDFDISREFTTGRDTDL